MGRVEGEGDLACDRRDYNERVCGGSDGGATPAATTATTADRDNGALRPSTVDSDVASCGVTVVSYGRLGRSIIRLGARAILCGSPSPVITIIVVVGRGQRDARDFLTPNSFYRNFKTDDAATVYY